ncbi:hypothetical protein CRE_25366 [Caenorhabditis remanei]|uniref:F-box domain-containing protein n=1 Tax=Caenorhabditis remanei TaxID=31234 RepID=E3LSR9_CAERE|nr:hypothetical protein CRE_25366 [Caenorhabditis remanei]
MQPLDVQPETSSSSETFLNLLKLPKKSLKKLYEYLNPVDCYNIAKCSKPLEHQVKKHKNLSINTIYLRFDNEKSCVGAYFDKFKYTACVFYSWRKGDGVRKTWNNSYYLKAHKFQNYLFCKINHPKEVKSLQPTLFPIDCISGMMETFKELCSMFPSQNAYIYVGVNVNDRKSCEAFCSTPLPRQIHCFRLIGTRPPKTDRVRKVFRAANVNGTVRVSHQVGPACMQDELINSYNVVLDNPEWITREELLSLNNVSIDIGHNNLTADDLNAFLMQWMFLDSDQIRVERLEITLSPQAFQNKRSITNGLILRDWNPKVREGEYFDASSYLARTTIRDPSSFLDCKFSKDIQRDDGRLATILFYGKKLYLALSYFNGPIGV